MTILFPAAGYGSRFSNLGFNDPKPFILVKGRPIIEYALSSLKLPGKYLVITYNLDTKYIKLLDAIYKKYNINGKTINLTYRTSGATETCISVKSEIDVNSSLVITNCDQYTPWDYNKFLEFSKNPYWDAIVTTYNHPPIELNSKSPYSHVKVNQKNEAIEFKEKVAISDHALNGIHYWKKAGDFLNSADKLLYDSKHKGETYISYTFQYLIEERKRITYYKMNDSEYVSLGTPEEIIKNIRKL